MLTLVRILPLLKTKTHTDKESIRPSKCVKKKLLNARKET